MATKRKSSSTPRLVNHLVNNPLVRVVGQHRPAQQVLQQVAQTTQLPLQRRASAGPSGDSSAVDYILIDPSLAREAATAGQIVADFPPSGVGYAAFTPGQRAALLEWLAQPTATAPPAFQQFYLAQLEVDLLEQLAGLAPEMPPVREELARLQQSPAWQSHLGLARLHLLADWLAQDGSQLPTWLHGNSVPASLLGVAFGLQALLNQPLQPHQLPVLLQQWTQETALPPSSLLALRLSSLAATLGTDPLTYALEQLGEPARQPLPWRTQHRDLRIALPQPDLRPVLEPLLRDLLVLQSEEAEETEQEDGPSTQAPAAKWQLVLEFGESRSEFFPFALTVAQQQPGYMALLDEDRRMVYRVHFQKNEMRRFWRLWEYVQSWSTTKVYLNGNEVNKWELYARL